MENLIVIELSFWSSNWGSDNQKFKTLTMINRAQRLLSSMTPSSLADNMCARAWTDMMQVGEDLSWIDHTWKVDLSPGENPRGSGMLLRVASQFSPGKTSPLTLYLQGSGNTKTKNSRSYLLCRNCKAKALGIECYDLCHHDSAPSDAPASWIAKCRRPISISTRSIIRLTSARLFRSLVLFGMYHSGWTLYRWRQPCS